MVATAKPKDTELKKAAPRNGAFFITIEGGEGAGKSSQIKRLEKNFVDLGYSVLLTREPGGTAGAEAVRHVLLSGAAEHLGSDMEAILFSAARSDHVEAVIKPALKKKQIVICDRFFDSTRVYQGITGNVSLGLLKSLEKVACDTIWPDLTIILDLDPKIGMERATKRRGVKAAPDRFEKESLALQRKRRKGFLSIAKEEPDRCVVVDASGTLAGVSKRIWSAVNERLDIKMKQTDMPKRFSHKALTKKKEATPKPANKR